jgi:hypothetical protein
MNLRDHEKRHQRCRFFYFYIFFHMHYKYICLKLVTLSLKITNDIRKRLNNVRVLWENTT